MAYLAAEHRKEVLSHLQSIVGPKVFETWCRALEFDRLDEDRILVPVPNDFYRQWVERELREPLERAFVKTFGRTPEIVFTIRAGSPSPVAVPAIAVPPPPKPAPPPAVPGLTLKPNYVFERFVVGPTNRIAHAATLSASENPGGFTNPLFLHGGSGLGKSHLLQALCHAVLARNPATRIRYMTCEGFVNDFIAAVRHGNIETFRGRYRNVDVLVVDDIHFLKDKESSQEEFFHTFNSLHTAGKQMIFSADAAPKHIPTLADRLTSRFEWGFVARIDPPTFEMRLAILRQHVDEKGHAIPDEVLTYIASTVQTNIRELEGAVNRVLANAVLTKRRPDLDLAKEALEDAAAALCEALAPQEIIDVVARHYGKKAADFKTRRWTKSTSLARHVAIYLCKQLTDLSLVEVGKAFGGKDHSTILYAVHRIEKRMASDAAFAREVDRLRRTIHAGR